MESTSWQRQVVLTMRIFAGGRERSNRDLGCEEIMVEKVEGSGAGDGGFPSTRQIDLKNQIFQKVFRKLGSN